MQLDITITGAEPIVRKLLSERFLQAPWRLLLRDVARETRREVQSYTPVRTGQARRNIKYAVKQRPEPGFARVFANYSRTGGAPQLAILAAGAPAHTIRPKSKRALAFGGRVVMWARHPGFRALDMFARAKAGAERRLEAALQEMARRLQIDWGQ